MTETAPPPTRADLRYWLSVPTRWNDNDALGHINNVLYFRYFEAVVVDLLTREAGLDWAGAQALPYAIDVRCRFRRPLAFPDVVDAGLSICSLGTSSATYSIALFAAGSQELAAYGHFVHVWVDRASERPVPIPNDVRAVYELYALIRE